MSCIPKAEESFRKEEEEKSNSRSSFHTGQEGNEPPYGQHVRMSEETRLARQLEDWMPTTDMLAEEEEKEEKEEEEEEEKRLRSFQNPSSLSRQTHLHYPRYQYGQNFNPQQFQGYP
ncbi:hypothetical protein K440DRAFT_635991 [Wilcoxina mikolae CBS 423.85]|nr:hypothetical protein K440DRAFT_635991 [Wilcoxina mikolae CBS 423.85]